MHGMSIFLEMECDIDSIGTFFSLNGAYSAILGMFTQKLAPLSSVGFTPG